MTISFNKNGRIITKCKTFRDGQNPHLKVPKALQILLVVFHESVVEQGVLESIYDRKILPVKSWTICDVP